MRRGAAGAIGAAILVVALGARSSAAPDPDPAATSQRPVTPRAVGPNGFELPDPQRGPVDPAAYIVGPGDWFQLSLFGPVSRELTIPVSPEGTLFLPGIGVIPISGFTLLQARARIEREVATQFHAVRVQVQLARIRRMQVVLAGQVKQPGPLEVPGYVRVADVLVADLLEPGASTRNIVIERPGAPAGERLVRADLERARRVGTGEGNPFLRDDDVVHVPFVTGFVTIEGAVANPGRYEFAPGDSLASMVDLAGGSQPATLDDIVIVRFRSATAVDTLHASLSRMRSIAGNLPLQEGDHVYLHFQPRYHELHRATVFGEVARPGPYPLEPGKTRLSELLGAAGGFLPGANLATLRVFRASSLARESDPELERLSRLSRNEMTASEYEVLRARLSARREDYRVSWDRLRALPELDLVIEDGDVVRVDRVMPSVRVDGEVRRPGVIQFVEGRSVAEYLRLAGGTSDRAARRQVRVTRAVTGQTILAHDVSSISPGDLIWVPERGDASIWQQMQSTMLLLAQIATVIIAVRK